MTDIILLIVLAVILGAAAGYVYKAKKSGAKCIGCPVEGGCVHKHGQAASCGRGCGCHTDGQ